MTVRQMKFEATSEFAFLNAFHSRLQYLVPGIEVSQKDAELGIDSVHLSFDSGYNHLLDKVLDEGAERPAFSLMCTRGEDGYDDWRVAVLAISEVLVRDPHNVHMVALELSRGHEGTEEEEVLFSHVFQFQPSAMAADIAGVELAEAVYGFLRDDRLPNIGHMEIKMTL